MVTIPGYKELSLIGQGATARVYRALQLSTGQQVAIKILNVGMQAWDAERSNQRFARELQLCAQLHNPHIVRLMDQGVCEDESPYAVFEYIPGYSLARYIAQQGPLSPAQTKELMLQALDALSCAHAQGVIHRDLKPQNLMVTQTGARLSLKVLDFGIGIWLDPIIQGKEVEKLTLANECLGTPAYSAPEQLKGEAAGTQSDLYAWGLIFLECLTGAPMLSGATTAEVIHRQLSDAAIVLPPFIAQHPVADLLREVLAKDPQRRMADAAELYQALAALNLDDVLPPAPVLEAPLDEQRTQIIPDPSAAQRAELRPLTLLCCQLKLLPVGDAPPPSPEALEQRLAERMAASQELLSRFGGYPAGMLGGGLMAYFGFPYHSDQDARLAVRTSLGLRRDVQSWNTEFAADNVRCVIQQAIHSGMAPLIQGKPLINDLSNTALGMLFSAASDQIMVSAPSQQLLRGHATLVASAMPLKLDTGAELPLYLLLDEQASDTTLLRDSGLLGRQKEMAQLLSCWRDCAEQSQAVAIEGEAGMGKSELVKAFADKVTTEKAGHALFWRCLPEYRHSALYPIVKGVEAGLGLTALNSIAERRNALRQALQQAGVEDESYFAVLGYWLNIPSESSEQRQHFSPERQKQLLFAALQPLILSLGQSQGLLLIIEDIHWLDAVSLEFIKALYEQATEQHLLVLLTLRPQADAEESLPWLTQRIPLAPLAEAESQRFAQQLLGERAANQTLVRKLVERSGGVPLFISELAQLDDIAHLDGELPLSLMDILCSRINALGEVKSTLQWAAVAGQGFDTALLQELIGLDTQVLLAQLEQLQAAGLLRLSQLDKQISYAFTHALYQDAACQQITSADLRRMHNQVAEQVAAQAEHNEHPDVALIARHYAAAHNFSKAAPFTLQAVREDLGMALSEQALERISGLLEWSQQLPKAEQHDVQLQAYELRVQALTHRFGWAHPSVLENVQKTQQFMQQKAVFSTHKVKVATLWSLGTFYHVSSQREQVHQIAEQLLAMADHLLDDSLAIMGRCLHGQGYWIDGCYSEAEVALGEVRQQYDKHRHSALARDYNLDAYTWATATLALVRWAQGDEEAAHQLVEQACDYAREIQHMPSLGIALMYRAYIYQFEQNRNKTLEVATELLGLADTYGLSAVLGYASALVGWATDDLERITGTLGLLKTLGCFLGLTYLQSMAAEVALRQGSLDAAQDLLNQGLQMAMDNGENYFLVSLYQQKAHVLLSDHSSQKVEQCLQRAHQLSLSQAIRGDGYLPLREDFKKDERVTNYLQNFS